ncbi:MAG: DUF952 domain-containing protein [Chitinophagaceae bacterium]|jgi:uncharacterized protein (DUF952 family)|nr:DUF952 domain-containing protein [Chitinophagaceae bacterium]
MESEYIYHVTTLKEWEAAKIKNEYKPVNFEQDGFIHCSVEKQIPGVLDRFYKGQTGLVKLKIEKEKVQRPVLFELAIDLDELFPHIYGALNLDSVVEVSTIS